MIVMLRGPYDGKYNPLTKYLENEAAAVEIMTFNQIEKLLGFALPRSADHHQAWWANQPKGQSLAWLRAGYRSSAVSVDKQQLTFVRADQLEAPLGDEKAEGRSALGQLTIAEAKERLAQTFGVDPTQIEITVRA